MQVFTADLLNHMIQEKEKKIKKNLKSVQTAEFYLS